MHPGNCGPGQGFEIVGIDNDMRRVLTPQPAARALLLTESSLPPAAITQPLSAPKPQCVIDAVDGRPPAAGGVLFAEYQRLRLQGWTNPTSTAGGPDEIWVSLTSVETGEKHFFKAGQQARPDVISFLRRPGMKNLGYTIITGLAGLTGAQCSTSTPWRTPEPMTAALPATCGTPRRRPSPCPGPWRSQG